MAMFLAAAGVMFLILCAGQAAAGERRVAVRLQAGETYLLRDLKKGGTPQVSFADDSHAFTLECPTEGACFVLGLAPGRGSVRATLNDGRRAVFEITVSALAREGHPLEPGVIEPRALGDIFPGHLHRPAPNRSADDGAGSGASLQPEPAVRAPAISYTQNPAANELELPPATARRRPHYPPPGTISLMADTSRVIDFGLPLSRISIADSKIADVDVVGPSSVMLVGHRPGFTTLAAWADNGDYWERTVRVDVGGQQEVELNVVVAELNRSKLEAQGVDVSVALANAGVSVVGLPGQVATPYSPSTNLTASGGAGTIVALPPTGVLPVGGSLIPLLLSQSLTYGVATQTGQVTTNYFLQLLEQHDLAKILARPRLIAESGHEADFLSGGEIPIVISQALNTSVVFKQFGTSVKFVPTVVDPSRGVIDLEVKPEVSEPDYTKGVQLFGFTIPAFVTRRAQTSVRMDSNQTLVIAGLILDTKRSQLTKVPYLGDVPYLGALFRHTSWNHVRSELIMTVTPRIVEPIPAGARVALPTQRGPMTRAEVRTRPLAQPNVTRPRLP